MFEAVYKLAGLYAMQRLGELGKFFPRIQRGLGVRGGCEVALHEIQHFWEADKANIVLSTDIFNAYNTRSRVAMAEALCLTRSCPPLSPLALGVLDALHTPHPQGRAALLARSLQTRGHAG